MDRSETKASGWGLIIVLSILTGLFVILSVVVMARGVSVLL